MDNFNNETIHEIIDKAMEKKDRVVSIFISTVGTTVNITPLEKTKNMWISKDTPGLHGLRPRHICSECGGASEHKTPYCPYCGEKLKLEDEYDG